jgi:hypothetical protein
LLSHLRPVLFSKTYTKTKATVENLSWLKVTTEHERWEKGSIQTRH